MTAIRVWAPNVSAIAVRAGGADVALEPRRRRVVDRPRPRRRHRLRVPARRQRRAGARPGLALAARRRARPEPRLRPAGLPVARRRLGRARPHRRRRLRAARRHVHRGRHLRLGDRTPGPPRRAGDHARRAAAGQRGQRHLELGLRRRGLVRGPRALRRPGRPEALRRRRARQGSRGRARRRLQPPRARRATTCPASGPT